ncbi:MAG: metalloregulator ArsR/SmtB family transcription factor [Acidimicrobiia bacterium]|nr:metalloregulator ArsR/SmtB family transcription factor [Acidimicrobiia bacterium]
MTNPCCAPVCDAPLSEAEATDLAAAMHALADPVRLRLLSHVAARPNGEACACELVDVVGRSQPTVSHHLKVLHGAGLLERERRGTWVWYRVAPTRLADLQNALAPPPPTTRETL